MEFLAVNKTALVLVAVGFLAALLLGYNTPLATQKVVFQAPAITEGGEGVLVYFKMWLRPGNGRILVNVDNAFYKEDSENSLRKAKRIAEKYIGLRLNAYDIVLEIDGQRIVGGESAGAMFSAAIAAAFTGKKLREDVTASAALTEEGLLAPVDSLEEKMRAAYEAGKDHFIIARGQQMQGEEFLKQKINIVRVDSAEEAIQLMLE